MCTFGVVFSEVKNSRSFWFEIFPFYTEGTKTCDNLIALKLWYMTMWYPPPQLPTFSNPCQHSVPLCYQDSQKALLLSNLSGPDSTSVCWSNFVLDSALERAEKNHLRRGRFIFEVATCSLLHSATFIFWIINKGRMHFKNKQEVTDIVHTHFTCI